MFLDNVLLRAKAKSLATEIRSVRTAHLNHRDWLRRKPEYRKNGGEWERDMLWGRRQYLGEAARHLHLVRMFLKGRTYKSVEPRCSRPPKVTKLISILRDTHLVPTGLGGPVDRAALRKWLGLKSLDVEPSLFGVRNTTQRLSGA